MKKLTIMAAAVSLAGCNVGHLFGEGPHVQGSGNVKTESRQTTGFSNIVSKGSTDCTVTIGPTTRVEITADDNILPLIETRVEGDTLYLETKGSYSTKTDVRVKVQVPDLVSYKTRGSGDAEILGIKSQRFAGEIVGSGDMKVVGEAESVSLSISGSGDMDLLGLTAKDASASISGSGDIRLFVTGTLDAQIRGSGDISYAGKPTKVNRSISGSGDISER